MLSRFTTWMPVANSALVAYSDPLVTPRIAVQGGHGLAVKTMFRFNPISPNKDECVGCLGYGRV